MELDTISVNINICLRTYQSTTRPGYNADYLIQFLLDNILVIDYQDLFAPKASLSISTVWRQKKFCKDHLHKEN